MTMAPGLRKFVLTAHVTSSVGWLGAIVAFLALGVIGVVSQDAQVVRGVYLVMEPAGWFVLVPLAVASLVTGLIQSLGSAWGLLRHYWVLAKLLINLLGVVVLLLYMQTLSFLADVAAQGSSIDDLSGAQGGGSPIVHSAVALLLLLLAAGLSVYKPRGMTRYGQRRQRKPAQPARAQPQRAMSQK